MKKLVPLFSEYNSKKENFYFDKKINEADIIMPLPNDFISSPDKIEQYIFAPQLELRINCLSTIIDDMAGQNAVKNNTNKINENLTKLVNELIKSENLSKLKIQDIWYINSFLSLKDSKFKLNDSIKSFYTEKENYYNSEILNSKTLEELKNKILPNNKINLWEFLNFLASFYNEESMRYSFFKAVGNQAEFEFTEKTGKDLYLAIISEAKKIIANTISKEWVYTTAQATVIEFIKNTGKVTIDAQPVKTNANPNDIKQKASAVKTQTPNKTTSSSSSKKTTSLRDSAKTYADSPISQLFKDAGVVESFRRMFVNEEDTENSGGKLLRTEIDGMDATDIYNKLSKKDKTFILPSDGNINQMNADDLCYRFIATFEGYTEGVKKDELVTDREVYQTGFGVVVPKGSSGVSSKAEAMDLLVKYCNQRITPKFREWVKKYRYVLNQNMINSLYSFAYNLGEGKLEKLTNGTSIPAGPRNEITLPYGMKLYTKASGKGNLGLKWRREAEVAMYNGEIKDESSFNSFMSTRNKMTLMTTSGDSKIEKAELAKAELKAPGEMPQQLSPELGGTTPSMKP